MVLETSVLIAGIDEFCFKRLSSSTCVDFKFLLAGIKWNIGREGLLVCLIAFGGDVNADVSKDDDGFACCIVTVDETGVLLKLFAAVVMKNCLLYKFSASDSVLLFLFNA